jgi:tetratricopeptide (TPR) repeat protein
MTESVLEDGSLKIINLSCNRCGFGHHVDGSLFCSRCGASLLANIGASWRSKWPMALGVAIILVPALWFGGGYLAGTPPTKAIPASKTGDSNRNPHQNISLEQDPQLNSLREKVVGAPESLEDLKNLGRALFNKLKEFPEMPQPLVLEAVDVFSMILNKDQRDPEATIWMGDVSFEQRLFQQSVEYYRRYLSIEPKDLVVKAKLASSLTFLKNFKESESLLREVLASDPNNFQAAAYLAVTLAELGDINGALGAIDTAVKVAPSTEAKERIERFRTSLLTPKKNLAANDSSKTSGEAASGNTAKDVDAASPAGGPVAAVTAYLKEHQIAGPKFVASQLEDQKIVIRMMDFPMQAMPPIVREKFIGGIRAIADKNGGQQLKISVRDANLGTVLWEENSGS